MAEKMGGVKMRTTHKLSADVFNSIVKLGTGLKKKKKKGKKVHAMIFVGAVCLMVPQSKF